MTYSNCYQAGKDWACNTAFAFYHVPAGGYSLEIEADGYERYPGEAACCSSGKANGGRGHTL